MAIELVRASNRHRSVMAVLAIIGAIIVLRLPFEYGPYRVFQFTLVLIYAIAVMGLNLLVGYNGQISIGHNAFFAMGAYTAAILIHRYDTNFILCILAAAAVTFVLGLLVGIPALRLHGLHLAIVTLALAISTTAVLQHFEGLTGGATGLTVKGLESPGWLDIEKDQYLYFVALILAVVMFVLARNITRSGFGRAMVAIKDNQLAAEAMGIDPKTFKVLTFAVSGMFAGVAGVIYVLAISYVSPEAFPLLLSVTFLVAIAVGGLGTLSGVVVGAIFVQFIPNVASEVNQSLATLIYGGVLIVVTIVMPRGIAGMFTRLIAHVVRIVDPLDIRATRAAEAVATPADTHP